MQAINGNQPASAIPQSMTESGHGTSVSSSPFDQSQAADPYTAAAIASYSKVQFNQDQLKSFY